MHIATISSQRQITLPKALLDEIGTKAGERLELKLKNQQIYLQKAPDISELSGCLHKYATQPIPTDSETDVAVLDHVKKTYAAKIARSR